MRAKPPPTTAMTPRIGAWLALGSLAVATAAGAAPLAPDSVWNEAARAAAPGWVRLWIAFMFVVFGSGLLFVRKHPAARWMVGAFVASHLASALEILVLGPERLTVGLIALNHCVFWTPALVVFHRRTRGTKAASAFGAWRGLVIATASFSLLFDFRDAARFVAGWAT